MQVEPGTPDVFLKDFAHKAKFSQRSSDHKMPVYSVIQHLPQSGDDQ